MNFVKRWQHWDKKYQKPKSDLVHSHSYLAKMPPNNISLTILALKQKKAEKSENKQNVKQKKGTTIDYFLHIVIA